MNGHLCPQCRQPAVPSARFCGHCGAALKDKTPAVEIVGGNRWGRKPGEFAVRIEVADLQALLTKGLDVEEGTLGLLFQQGRMAGTLQPGPHTLETVGQRLKNLILATPCSVLLIDAGDTLLDVGCPDLRTADDQLVAARLQLVVGLQNPRDFFVHFVKGQTLVTTEQLVARIRELVQASLRPLVADCGADELYGNRELTERIELEMRETLAHRFERLGLVFDRVEFCDFTGEFDDAVRQQRGELHRKQALARLDQQRRQLNERLASEQAREELRKLKGEAEFKQWVKRLEHELFRRDLLRRQEREELWRQFQEQAQNHELARQHLLAMADWQRRRELARLGHEATVERMAQQHQESLQGLRQRGELDEQERRQRESALAAELDARTDRETRAFQHRLQQERATFDEQLRQQREQFGLGQEQKRVTARDELDAEKARREHELDTLDRLMDVKHRYQERSQRLVHDERRMRHELEEQSAQGQHARKLEQLEKFGQLSVPALIAASAPEQAALLADLQKTETLKQMDAEQILALWAEGSEAIARAFAERFKASGQEQAGEEARRLYERMLSEKDRTAETIQATHREHLQAFQQLVQTALETQRDTSVARHGGQKPPVE